MYIIYIFDSKKIVRYIYSIMYIIYIPDFGRSMHLWPAFVSKGEISSRTPAARKLQTDFTTEASIQTKIYTG